MRPVINIASGSARFGDARPPVVYAGRSRPAANKQKRSALSTPGKLGLYPQKPLRHAPLQSKDRLGGSRCPVMTRFREGSQFEGLWELALPLPPLPCPRRLYTPRFSLVADQWRRRGNLGEINLRSLAAVDVVGGGFDSQGEEVTSSYQHGMSSYAPNMALGKPTEGRRSDSPRRCYRGQPRRCLFYHGRPQDP